MGQIAIIGEGAGAWLTASICARFLAARPSDVIVSTEGRETLIDLLTLRPDMARLHSALGLDVSKLNGAKAINAWRADNNQVIPLTPLGRALGAVAFHHLLTRARRGEALRGYVPAGSPASGAWQVSSASYALALEAIAKRAGVQTGRAGKDAFRIYIGGRAEPHIWQEDGLHLNWPMFGEKLPTALRLHALYQLLMSLVSHWPGTDWLDIERRALANRVEALKPCLLEMTGLLSGDEGAHPRLAHRVEMWRTCGRLIPVDDDPFAPAEWIGALTYAVGVPLGYDRLADRFTLDEINAHIAACKLKEASNV